MHYGLVEKIDLVEIFAISITYFHPFVDGIVLLISYGVTNMNPFYLNYTVNHLCSLCVVFTSPDLTCLHRKDTIMHIKMSQTYT